MAPCPETANELSIVCELGKRHKKRETEILQQTLIIFIYKPFNCILHKVFTTLYFTCQIMTHKIILITSLPGCRRQGAVEFLFSPQVVENSLHFSAEMESPAYNPFGRYL